MYASNVRLLVDRAADSFFLIDSRGSFVDVNQRACDALGYTHEELVTLSVPDITFGFERSFEEEFNLMVPGVPVTLPGHLRRRDGTAFPVEVRSVLIELGGRPHSFALVRDLTDRKQAEDTLLGHARELAKLDERSRIAREIHDTLAQSLTSRVFQLEAVKKVVREESATARAEIDSAVWLARETLEEARRSVWDLQSLVLVSGNLSDAIRQEVSKTTEVGIQVVLDVRGENVVPMNRGNELAALRIVQESLSNIRRHAHAKTAMVRVGFSSTEVRLNISDHGVGFDSSKLHGLISSPTGAGFGLISMQERAREVGGYVEFTAYLGFGTEVDAHIPYQPRPKEVPGVKEFSPTTSRSTRTPSHAIRILIVDDQEMVLKGVRNMLEESDEVIVAGEARDGEDAIEKIRAMLQMWYCWIFGCRSWAAWKRCGGCVRWDWRLELFSCLYTPMIGTPSTGFRRALAAIC